MENSNTGTYKKILLYSAVACIVLALLLSVVLLRYIATPYAAVQISRMLSDSLGQPVVIEHVTVSGRTLHLKGLSLANPDGFPRAKLLSIDSIIIIPVWRTLLSDSRTFEKISVEGVTVDLQRNSANIWNIDQLRRRLSSTKPSSSELFIHQLAITKGSLQLLDQKIAGLNLNISNLATKGSEKSGFGLEFDDPGSNHYTLSGKARLSKDPELDISLSSSSISLKSLSETLKINSRYLPEKGNANLQLSVYLLNGMVHGSGEMNFSSAVIPTVGRGDAFSGNLSLSIGYDLHKDLLTIENIALHMNKLLAVRASGSVKELKRARDFVVDVGTDEIDIGKIAPLLPELEHRKITVNGTLGKSSLHLSGNAVDGITVAKGNLGLSHGLLMQDKRLFFNDLSVTAAVSRAGNFVTVSGKATQAQSQRGAILEALDAPYKVTMDGHFKKIKAQSPALSAKAQGVSFTCSLSYTDGTGLIENATLKSNDLSVALGRLSARIPEKQVSSATVRYPVTADFSGCDLRRGDALLKKLSGTIRGAYAYNSKVKWLEGTTELYAEKLAWQGKETGATKLLAVFSESGGTVDISVAVLGGSVQGNAVYNPFALRDRVVFKINSKGIQLAGIKKYAGFRGDTEVSEGILDAAGDGNYSLSKGLFCHVEAQGKKIAVTGKAGKTLLSAGGIKVIGDVSGKKLVITEALLTAGKNVALKAGGTLENAFQPDRQGRIDFTVPNTALANVVDSFLSSMPRSIQEATVAGYLAAEGAVNLQEGKILVDGAVTLAHISIDAPTEKMKVSDINGVLPLSLDLAGKSVVKPPSSASFNRQNFNALVKQLHQTARNGDTITIGNSSFGGLNMDSVKIRLRAARGATEIISLDSSLFEGALFGKGFITVQNGIFYRGDMLINDLSLVQICKAFPAITGYISGKVDGVVSIQGKGKQLSGITGFTEFWARETAGEKMLVSKEFLQRLSGKKLSGFFFSSDRPYNHAGIKAALENGFLTFDSLDISHTNILGVRDLSVSIAPSQNRIAIDHLLNSIKEATVRGKSATGTAGKDAPSDASPATEFKWAD
jgi:hypothetical protein